MGGGAGDIKVQTSSSELQACMKLGSRPTSSAGPQCAICLTGPCRVREGTPMPPLTAQSEEYKEDIRVRLKKKVLDRAGTTF